MTRAAAPALVLSALLVALGGLVLGACAEQQTGTPKERFVALLEQPGVHRFDQVQVGTDGKTIDPATAECIATAFERNHWTLAAALDNKVLAEVDVKNLNRDIVACERDASTTTVPFG